MANRDFSLFTASLNPFRILDRQIERMFDDGFGAAAAGAVAKAPDIAKLQPSSLFIRAVGLTGRMNGNRENG